jgi:hypothetical protein
MADIFRLPANDSDMFRSSNGKLRKRYCATFEAFDTPSAAYLSGAIRIRLRHSRFP